jgi:hypothetical protein
MWCVAGLLPISPLVFGELATLFRQSCPGGLVIVVLNEQPPANDADISILASDGPDAIVRALHESQPSKSQLGGRAEADKWPLFRTPPVGSARRLPAKQFARCCNSPVL